MRRLFLAVSLGLSMPIGAAHSAGAPILSIGGSIRERAESVTNPLFGIEDAGEDSVLLHRLLVHADLELDEGTGFFVEFGNHLATARRFGEQPTDVDRLDLQQGYIELKHGVLSLKAGRQEISLGSSRLVGIRDGPNIRRSFDAVRTTLSFPSVSVDVFFGRPITLSTGVLDDVGDRSTGLWGVYVTKTVAPDTTFDLYYLGLRRASARFIEGVGCEMRHSVGARFAGRYEKLDWDLEAVEQFGRFGSGEIEAWTVAADVGYTFPATMKPRIGAKADVASGDAKAGDGRLGSFNALFPKLPYFSEANLIVPTNVIDFHPEVSLSPSDKVRVIGGFDLLWRQRSGDGYYVSPLRAIAGPTDKGRFIGNQWIIEANWNPRASINFATSFVSFTPSAAIRALDGRAGHFLMVSTTYRF